MSVPIRLHIDCILQKCREIPIGVLLIIAPTGTGKTMGMRNLVLHNQDVYRKTVMVQPTRMATYSLEGIRTMTPMQLIQNFLSKNRLDYDTVILDEVHTLCVEYHTILSILQKTGHHQKKRIILMSATPNVSDLQKFFPSLHVYTTPVSSPFPINIHYDHMTYPGFASYRLMVSHVANLLKKHPYHKRVLVFLYTHEHCDKMAKEMKETAIVYNGGKTFALYGGMDKKDMQTWHEFLEKEETFIVFSTNVAETSITIPNLSLIIDFGIRCIQRNHRIVYSYCPKSNLIQRSGRTGRTCKGVVVRCMREDDFCTRPDTDRVEYNWDMIVLLMLRYKHDPSRYLPDNVPLQNIIQKFRFYGFLDEKGVVDHKLMSFVLKCPLLLKNSCHLYSFLKTTQNTKVFALYILSCALIDQMEARVTRIYYHSCDMKISRARLLEKIRKIFTQDADELMLYLNIILSCMLNEKPIDISNAFSLNFRTIRQISSSTTRLWGFVHQYMGRPLQSSWQDALRNKVHIKTTPDWERKNTYPILWLKEKYMDQIRCCYMANPLTPRLLLMNDMMWRPNFIMGSHHFILSPFTQIHNHNRCVLVLSYDDTEVYKWIDPSHVLPEITVMSFSLYTYPPSPIDRFIRDIRRNIQKGYFHWNIVKKKKEKTRKNFQHVLEDIQEDVAYRPGFWKMHRSLEQFADYFDKINKILCKDRT